MMTSSPRAAFLINFESTFCASRIEYMVYMLLVQRGQVKDDFSQQTTAS